MSCSTDEFEYGDEGPILTFDYRTEVRHRARAVGAGMMVLRLLEHRGVDVPADVRQRILQCNVLPKQKLWFDRALVAECVDEVVDELYRLERNMGSGLIRCVGPSDSRG